MLILWAPGGFRVTCYYYRGAYYKAFWADPPSCAVGEPRKKYLGERSFPLILQNIHRYFLYLALVFLILLAHDVWKAFWFDGRLRHRRRHSGFADNVILLGCYTFGCHSFAIWWAAFAIASPRSRSQEVYDCVSCLNRRHMRLPGAACLRSVLPTSMCACARWASGRTGEFFRWPSTVTHEHDVLVIGAGGAGLRAAIEASPPA